MLLGDDDRRRESGSLEGAFDDRAAHAVHRGVGDRDARHIGAEPDARRGRDVRVGPRLVEAFDALVVGFGEGDLDRIEPRDPLGDLGVDRGDDLRAGVEVDLVPVVGGRVVRSGDDDAGGRAESGDRPCEDRGRLYAGKQHRSHAHRRKHAGRVEREQVALATSVVCDHDAARSRLGNAVEQPPAESGRGLPDHQPVHPHRAGGDRRSETRCTELQRAVESCRQLGVVARLGGTDQPVELEADVVVGLGVAPPARRLEEVRIRTGGVSSRRVLSHPR